MQETFDLFEEISRFFNKYSQVILLSISVAVVGLSAYGIKVYMQESAGKKAFKAFLQIEKMRNQHIKSSDTENDDEFATEEEKWNAVAVAADKALHENSGSSLGKHFGILKIEAFIKLGKNEEALECINACLGKLNNSPIKDMLSAKKALLQLDSDNQTARAEGLDLLKKIANSDSSAKDFGYFWLGEYHWTQGQIQEAKVVWNSLVTESTKVSNDHDAAFSDKMFQSPWVKKAKEKLKLIQ